MQATIKSGTRSRLESGALGLGPGLGRSARGHQQEGQRDHADHEGQDDGEHEVADDPRIDRGEPGGERLVVQDVAVPGDRDRRSTDGDHEVGGGTEQRRGCDPASAAPSSAAARGRPPAAGPARWRGRRDRRGGRGARTGACSCGSIRRWRQDGLARVASAWSHSREEAGPPCDPSVPLPWRPAYCWRLPPRRRRPSPPCAACCSRPAASAISATRPTPDAEGRLWLTVPLAQVDDILKSLTVLGARRCRALGQPAGADAAGRPVSRRAVRRGRPGRPAEPARPPARGGGRGRGPGQPARPDPDAWRARRSSKARAASARHRLSLAGPEGIRSVILETIDGLSFADAELQRRDRPGPGAAGRGRLGAGAQARDQAGRRPGGAGGPGLSRRDALVEGELAAGRRPGRRAAAGLGDPRERQRPGLARRGGDPDRRQPAGTAAGAVREPLRAAARGARSTAKRARSGRTAVAMAAAPPMEAESAVRSLRGRRRRRWRPARRRS